MILFCNWTKVLLNFLLSNTWRSLSWIFFPRIVLTWNSIFGLLLDLNIHLRDEEWMIECSLSSNSTAWILIKHLLQQVKCFHLCFIVNLTTEVEIACSILGQNLIVFLALEDRASKKKIMENDSSWEDITYWITLGAHVLDINDFRGNEARCTTSDKQILLLLCMCGKSEIANGKILRIVVSEDNILGLEVTVDYFMFGEMGKGLEYILHNLLYLLDL